MSFTASMTRGMASIAAKVRRLGVYLRQVYRLLQDVRRRYPGSVVTIVLASAGSLACQATTLLALYAYLRALQHDTPLLGMAARDSLPLFLLVAAVTLLLLVAHSLLEYRAGSAILRLSRRYQSEGTSEALALASALPHWFAEGDARRISMAHLRQLLSVDVSHRSRLVRVALLSVIPAARLVLCTIALLWLNPVFSVVVVAAAGLPVLGIYAVGRKVADSITVREAGSPPVFPQQRRRLHDSWQRGLPLRPDELSWESTLGPEDSRFRQYYRRLQAKIQADFLVSSANTVGIAVLIIALGLWVLRAPEGNWSLWLTYLVVLRYFLSSLRNFVRLLVRSTRFLRQTQRFARFVAAAALAVAQPDPAAVKCPQPVAAAFKGDRKALDDDDEDDDFDD